MNNISEYILCAAIKRIKPKDIKCYWNNDINLIEIGYRHCDIYQRFPNEMSNKPNDQGFYTSKGRFVNRKEAMKIAYECGQVTEDVAIKDSEGKTLQDKYKMLFSEDLY